MSFVHVVAVSFYLYKTLSMAVIRTDGEEASIGLDFYRRL